MSDDRGAREPQFRHQCHCGRPLRFTMADWRKNRAGVLDRGVVDPLPLDTQAADSLAKSRAACFRLPHHGQAIRASVSADPGSLAPDIGARSMSWATMRVYNLGTVTLRARATVSQYAYLCGGSHDFDRLDRPLITGPIMLEEDCFIGAKAIILMGVTVGESALVGAGAVVARDVPANTVVVGNPARVIKHRCLVNTRVTNE